VRPMFMKKVLSAQFSVLSETARCIIFTEH